MRCLGGCPAVVPAAEQIAAPAAAAAVGVFALLKAFSQGATALTGVEAISNGVPAFRRPQAKNAAATLAIMGAIAVTMFLGISYLATQVHGVVAERAAIGRRPDRRRGLRHNASGSTSSRSFTAAILILAANTAYQDFPRLASILARDRFMPRQFVNRGDRLVFSNGVVALGLLSCADDLPVRRGPEHADPVLRGRRVHLVHAVADAAWSDTGCASGRKGDAAIKGWRRSIVINIVGAITTFVVLIVVILSKFKDGAWLVDPHHARSGPGVLRDPPALQRGSVRWCTAVRKSPVWSAPPTWCCWCGRPTRPRPRRSATSDPSGRNPSMR